MEVEVYGEGFYSYGAVIWIEIAYTYTITALR